MGLFDKIKGPVFYKDDSEAEKQLVALKKLREKATSAQAEHLDQEISKVEAGIIGERQVHFELENSHIPMYVLHDVFLEHNGLTAQIDYLVITRKNSYVIECKNLYGNIEINNSGSFIRAWKYGNKVNKEGIYSPITQNQRHMELIKEIRVQAKGNFITKAIFEKYFYSNYHSIVVLANPKTVLNDKYAKKEVKEQVIRADQLVAYIKKLDEQVKDYSASDKELEEVASFFLEQHKQNPVDYIKKFREMLAEEAEESTENTATKADKTEVPSCPVCGAPMVLRTSQKGNNKGGKFYGCSKFPKCRGIRQAN